jgi:ribosome-associated protein
MEALKKSIKNILEDNKAESIVLMDVKNKSSVTDLMFIASGRSTRHVKAIADNLVTKLKKSKIKPLGVEGYTKSEWILLDYGDLLVHVMHPEARDFYSLEKLWDESIDSDNFTYK